MRSLEASIDALYQGPLDEFVASRKALAKSLAGDAAHRVKQLQKPTSVAWAVNQLYWHRRSAYDRLVKSGKKLRAAQIGALSGQRVNVREPTDEHRAAVAQAVAETSQLAAEAGLHPNPDELSRTIEALSLDTSVVEGPGRLGKALQPAGFEALAGLVVNAPPQGRAARPTRSEGSSSAATTAKRATAERQAREREEAEAAEATRQRAAATKKAAAAVVLAREAEDRARSEWERCKQDRETAEQALADLQ